MWGSWIDIKSNKMPYMIWYKEIVCDPKDFYVPLGLIKLVVAF